MKKQNMNQSKIKILPLLKPLFALFPLLKKIPICIQYHLAFLEKLLLFLLLVLSLLGKEINTSYLHT